MSRSSPEAVTCAELLKELSGPDAYPHRVDSVALRETHVSWVFLAGDFAYKVKKPITTSFLDYSTLAQREHCCHEEVRLDRRYANDLYVGVVPITLDHGCLRVEGRGYPVEFAVKMHRFPDHALLRDRLDAGKLSCDEVLQLAHAVARFHAVAERADPHSPWGAPDSVADDAIDNLKDLRLSPLTVDFSSKITSLSRWTDEYFVKHRMLFAQRVANGFIRECHGDLHLANVIHWRDRLMPFDGIEFNDEFRWIDVMSDAAFLAMDLAARGHPELSHSFINAYLEQTGDHASLPLMRWYLVYRALVRAKVAAIQAAQHSRQPDAVASDLSACALHVDLAERFTQCPRPTLWITHGLSGSGKTFGSESVVQRFGAIRLRSDVERKRHFGMSPNERPDSITRSKIYSESAGDATYTRLRRLATGILHAQYSVIVDAAFLMRNDRESFRQLAADQGVGFSILDFEVDVETLRERITRRAAKNDDASDADISVLESQLASHEPLTESERVNVVAIPETSLSAQP